MPIREFEDSGHLAWRVWDTRPVPGAVFDERLKAGWLTFECDGTRKRLAPIPLGWEGASAARLETMCRAAQPVRWSGTTGSLASDADGRAETR